MINKCDTYYQLTNKVFLFKHKNGGEREKK